MCYLEKFFASKMYSHSLIGYIDKDLVTQLKSGEIRAFYMGFTIQVRSCGRQILTMARTMSSSPVSTCLPLFSSKM